MLNRETGVVFLFVLGKGKLGAQAWGEDFTDPTPASDPTADCLPSLFPLTLIFLIQF